MTFCSKIFIKTPYSHAHIWSKNVNSVNTTLFYGHKIQQDALFVPLFHEKITALMPIFYQKCVYSLKNTLLSCPYQSKKRPFSQKHGALMCFFFKFFMKNSCCRAHDWSKNVNFVKTNLYFGPKKSQDALFSYFSLKNYCSYVNILSKKRPFSRKKQLSSPRFAKKTSTLLKTNFSHVCFFLIFHKLPILSCRYFVKKRQFCQNYNT